MFRDDKREDPDVLALCKEENAHCSAAMAGTEVRSNPSPLRLHSVCSLPLTSQRRVQELQAALFKEMRSRIQEDEETAPERTDGYYYYTRCVVPIGEKIKRLPQGQCCPIPLPTLAAPTAMWKGNSTRSSAAAS
jgi:hypothetical protein